MVPHLTTALTGPLLELEKHFLDNATAIERWMRTQWQEHLPPFYGSTDLRNSGFKLAPVDLNLFPGGFNNLNDAFMPLCVQAAQAAIERICVGATAILLIPENHTRNQFYLQNVAKLVSILRLTGLEVRLGSLLPEITAPTVVELANGASLTLEPLERHGRVPLPPGPPFRCDLRHLGREPAARRREAARRRGSRGLRQLRHRPRAAQRLQRSQYRCRIRGVGCLRVADR